MRSINEVEKSPGVYGYEYSKIDNIVADVFNAPAYSLDDNTSINPSTRVNKQFSFVMYNDSTDRINRIFYVKDASGILYNVSSIQSYPPRVRVTIGEYAKETLEELEVE